MSNSMFQSFPKTENADLIGNKEMELTKETNKPMLSYRDALLSKFTRRTNHRIIDQMSKDQDKRNDISKS